MHSRTFSTYTRVLAPRFATTIKEVGKPALTKSIEVKRPFGFDKPILLNHKVHSYSLSSVKDYFFSPEAKELRQKRLDHDIVHSPFYESKSFQNTNGKIFTPPISYFKADKSKYFPDFIASTLSTKSVSLGELLEGKVSIVRVYLTVSGEKCVDTFFQKDGKDLAGADFESFKEEHPNSQIIDINVPQNWMKGFMIGLSKSNIKKQIPVERQDKYFVLPDHTFGYEIRQVLLCDNMCSGYIYVLDGEGKIRWATSGYADEEELELMWKCVRGVEKEISS
ncbi:uncharacterized protein CANTADRAFT_21521 [Suhomyces tanzawaensis NRRL Y-17324]|uniref:Mitochondrial ATPase complex subunit ATP10 n=1 Tax=Suhomyces tanzawaensis NRRL Y-17324 TaxID=984487 RepID=A0A1E4SL91_9ASCO|nr:uncharacterized protein CANTADRAFT_21521 [Suhomyces tanzawaensis NRRL Y-17324]ODV80281.1 hypothetical protein CANTADRAFT_21521 [Suhomyces tanzawaensis NRRL Y-17324]